MGNKLNVLTADWLKENGYTYDKAEYWNSFARIRKDLFGFIDFVGIKNGDGIIAVQSTSASNHSARREKILSSDKAFEWVKGGAGILLISWRKGPSTRMLTSGKISTVMKWIPRIDPITKEDFEAERNTAA